MWREKTDKRIVAAGVLAFALIVGYQSWYDMQPHPVPNKAFTYSPYILADEEAELKNFPAGTASVVAWLGDFKVTDGRAAFTPSPLVPVNLPQQEVMVQFTFDALPSVYDTAVQPIKAAVKPWKNEGNLLNDIYIEYRPDTLDLDAMGTFLTGLRSSLMREFYVVLQLKRAPFAADPKLRNKLANLLNAVEFFVYDLKDAQKPGETVVETINRLDSEELPFLLRTSDPPATADMVKAFPEPKQFFRGFLVDRKQTDQEKKP